VLAGVLADRLGYGWAFGVTGGIMLVAACAWLTTRETLRAAKGANSADGR
jgi:DHA1 family multidrug resistance protein-like MFS transporter